MTEIKYKEIILENNIDLSPQDFEYIRGTIKNGGVVIIKNGQLAGMLFTELLKEIMQVKPEEISPNFKFILILNRDEAIKNSSIYEECRVINDNLINEEDMELSLLNKKYFFNNKFISVKDRVLTMVSKIPTQIYSFLLNSNLHFFRLFLRKLVYSYIILFSVLENLDLKNPFTFGKKDFYILCKFIITYIEGENFTEDKYKNEFINQENTVGLNYINFISILNNIFVLNRQMGKHEEYLVNSLINYIFNFKTFMTPEFYLRI